MLADGEDCVFRFLPNGLSDLAFATMDSNCDGGGVDVASEEEEEVANLDVCRLGILLVLAFLNGTLKALVERMQQVVAIVAIRMYL